MEDNAAPKAKGKGKGKAGAPPPPKERVAPPKLEPDNAPAAKPKAAAPSANPNDMFAQIRAKQEERERKQREIESGKVKLVDASVDREKREKIKVVVTTLKENLRIRHEPSAEAHNFLLEHEVELFPHVATKLDEPKLRQLTKLLGSEECVTLLIPRCVGAVLNAIIQSMQPRPTQYDECKAIEPLRKHGILEKPLLNKMLAAKTDGAYVLDALPKLAEALQVETDRLKDACQRALQPEPEQDEEPAKVATEAIPPSQMLEEIRTSLDSLVSESTAKSALWCKIEELDKVLTTTTKERDVMKKILLENKLPTEIVDFKTATERMNKACEKLAKAKSPQEMFQLENEIEKWEKCIRMSDDYKNMEKDKARKWDEEQDKPNQKALKEIRGYVPTNIRRITTKDLMNIVPQDIAERVKANRILWWVRDSPAFTAKVHIGALRHEYPMTALTLVELRAVYAVCPAEFENDPSGEKREWRDALLNKLKAMIDDPHLKEDKKRPEIYDELEYFQPEAMVREITPPAENDEKFRMAQKDASTNETSEATTPPGPPTETTASALPAATQEALPSCTININITLTRTKSATLTSAGGDKHVTWKCPQGHMCREKSKFCPNCGSPRPETSAPTTTMPTNSTDDSQTESKIDLGESVEIGPFGVRPVDYDKIGFAAHVCMQEEKPVRRVGCYQVTLDDSSLVDLVRRLPEPVTTGPLSPCSPITLPPDVRKLASIPEEAENFAFAYPLPGIDSKIAEEMMAREGCDPAVIFLVYGGYVYFDCDGSVRGLNSLVPGNALVFDGPITLASPKTMGLLHHGNRIKPVTAPSLAQLGVTGFAWLLPGERFDDNTGTDWSDGAFLYEFKDAPERNCYFKIISPDSDQSRGKTGKRRSTEDAFQVITDDKEGSTAESSAKSMPNPYMVINPSEALLAELRGLENLKAVKIRARELGISDETIEELEDEEDPQEAIIQKVLANQATTPDPQQTLLAELRGLENLKAVKIRARELGISNETIEDLEDEEDPQEAIIQRILANQAPKC